MKRKINYISIPKQGNTTAILIASKIGSRFETSEQKGISHFVEHMCFKGTKKRTGRQITKQLEQYGGVLNASTSREITQYYVKIAHKHKAESFEILKDMVFNPIFPEKEVDKERKVILEELKMCQDDPSQQIFDYVSQALFGLKSSFSLPIIGTKTTLANIKRASLVEHHKRNYEDLTIVQVGNVKKKEGVEEYNLISKGEKIKYNKQNKFYFSKRDIEQSNVAISGYVNLTTIDRLDRYFAFEILTSIFRDMSGRLFSVIREKNNLVYRIQFYSQMYRYGGVQWWVTLGLEQKNINKAYDLTIKELTRPITKKELKYGLVKLLGRKSMYLDDPLRVANEVIDCVNVKIDYREVIYNYEKRYKKVGELINQYQDAINFKNNVLVAITPEKK